MDQDWKVVGQFGWFAVGRSLEIAWEWTGGTGKYKGISGSNTFVGVLQVNFADGTASGYATWNR